MEGETLFPGLRAAIGSSVTRNPVTQEVRDDPPVRRPGETDAQYRQRLEDHRVLEQALDPVFKEEGFRERAYQDPGGVWTVGYGRTGPDVGPDTRMTEPEAREWTRQYLSRDLERMRRNGVRPTPQTLSFTYNAGYGRFQKLGAEEAARAGDWKRVGDLMAGITTAKGVEQPGLVARRQREREALLEYVASLDQEAETPQEPQAPDLQGLRAAIRAAQQQSQGLQERVSGVEAGVVPPEEDGTNWGRIGTIAAAIGAAALGARGVAKGMMRGATPTPTPGPGVIGRPPLPYRNLQNQLTTQAPPTHPATPEQAAELVQMRERRVRSINRLRDLPRPMDPDSEIARSVDDILENGPSSMRKMRPIDAEIADVQEQLYRDGIVKGSGVVPDAEWERMAREFKANQGGKEFYLDNPDEVFTDPRLTAAALVHREHTEAFIAAAKRSADPTVPFEKQELAARLAGEHFERMTGAAQRLARDKSAIGRAMRSLRFLDRLYKADANNTATWLSMAEKLAGKELDKADAMALVHLVSGGHYQQAAAKLNQLRTAHWLDKTDEWLRSSMQLTLLRPFRDILSNSINVADKAIARRVGGMADTVFGVMTGKRALMPPGLRQQVKVTLQGAKTGGLDALRLLARKDVPDDLEFQRRVAERMDFTNETTFTHPVTHWIATQARRWFTAADYPAYRAAVNDALADRAMVAAYNAGKRGKDLTPAAMAIFENPGPKMMLQAMTEAREAVWQNTNFVATGFHKGMGMASPGVRFMARRVVPFVHTASSMVFQAVNQSPVGAIKTGLDLSKLMAGILRKNPDGELQRQVAMRLGMHATGAGWMFLGYWLASKNDIRGAYNETDRRGNAADEERNARPMSVKVDGKWYAISMLLGPQAMLMAMGAGLHEGFKRLAAAEAADPTGELRWQQKFGAVAAPFAREAVGAVEELPLAEGAKTVGMLTRDLKQDGIGAGTGGLAGRIATQAVPSVVQQVAESMDTDASGDVVRRETRGGDFSESLRNTILEAIPGARESLPVRPTPFGREGTGNDLNLPLQLANPARSRYAEHDDWVTELADEHDAFPTTAPLLEGETRAEYAQRRAIEGPEEREALGRILQGDIDYGRGYNSALRAWEKAGSPIPSPEYTAMLRQAVSGIRSARSRDRRKARGALDE